MGFDLERFVKELPNHLQCPICLEAATSPHIVCQAEHVLCLSCVEDIEDEVDIERESAKCPICREDLTARESKVLKRALEEYKVRCVRRKEGCEWTGSVSDVSAHENMECSHRPICCPDCHDTYAAHRQPEHAKTCSMAIIACPRGGRNCGGLPGYGLHRRKDAEPHDSMCGEYSCRVNCGTRTTRRNLPVHETTCASVRNQYHPLVQHVEAANLEVARLRSLLESSTVSSPATTLQSDSSASPVVLDADVKPSTMAYPPPRPPRFWLPAQPSSLEETTSRRPLSAECRKHLMDTPAEQQQSQANSSKRFKST